MNTPLAVQPHCSLRRNSLQSGHFRLMATLALAAGLLTAPFLGAQQPANNSGNPELAPPPPSQTAAVRLSDVEGSVQLSSGNMILASQALPNTPVFEGTLITTADDGRAELQFDDGSVTRIPPDSALLVSVLRKDGGSAQSELDLQKGMAYFELQPSNSGDSIRVHFGDNIVTTSGFTVMRIRYDTPPGEFAVFSGNAHLTSGNALALDLHGGETVTLNATDPQNYQLAESIEPDSWDEWNSDRDEALTTAEADRAVASNQLPDGNNPAYSDLDANGNWYNVPGQGYVWSPYEAAYSGWDPYGCGSWMWTPNFGYIWVSCESWGYMPYMFGQWNYYGGFGWGWSPGYGGAWWNNGGWSNNVIATRKIHYRPPERPRGGPIKPGGVTVFPKRPMEQPHKIVIVDRIKDNGHAKPVRPHGAPLTVAGTRIEPVRPVAIKQRTNFSEFNGNRRTSLTNRSGSGGQYNGFVAAPPRMMPSRPVFRSSPTVNQGIVRPPSSLGTSMPRPEAPHYSMPRPPSPSVVNRAPSVSAPSFHPAGPPRMSAPHVSAPHMSSPHMSAPPMSAPHVSAPHVSSAPRGGRPHR